jgi:hypothetical protein
MPRSHDSGRQPWNERVVRCVVNHLIPTMKPYAGHATDKLVLIFMARHAHPGGCGITVTRDTLAGWLGCEERTVSVALARLRSNGYLVIDGREAHGGYRHRIILCQRCRVDTAKWPCQRCPPPPAAATPSRPSAVSSGHPNRELQGEPTATPVIPDRGRGSASSDGDGRTGPDARSRTPFGGRRQAADAAFKPSNQAREATAGAVIPFKARPSDAGAQGGAARTGSRMSSGASTGNPVSNPSDGRLFEPEANHDPARWAR